ncbi:MAG: DUF5615 family PIN-like protein [Anaerolineae bacterium]|nr:DUF5615 family PIN-like protein [Anaerolineae bacterium]
MAAGKIVFYFDEMMPRDVADELIRSGHKVLMAVDAGMVGKDDMTEHLEFAAERSYVLVTRDRPFAGRAMKRTDHAGLICWTGAQNDFGGLVRALSDFAARRRPEDAAGQVFWLK